MQDAHAEPSDRRIDNSQAAEDCRSWIEHAPPRRRRDCLGDLAFVKRIVAGPEPTPWALSEAAGSRTIGVVLGGTKVAPCLLFSRR